MPTLEALDEAIAECQKWAIQIEEYSGSPDMLDILHHGHDAARQNVINLAKAM